MLGRLPDRALNSYYKDGGLSVHSTLNKRQGIYASTGSLGHGLAIGIGYAIANPKKEVWVVMGDGELDEGSVHESLRIIKKLGIKNIYPVIDANGLQGYSEGVLDCPDGTRPYYSIKGQDWGKGIENEIVSHYTIVTPEIYKHWMKYSKKTEAERLKKIQEYIKLKGK
jgi:thiamine pyrophosphate-dependent acetolactate synthase large subunit-like protein